VGISSNGFKLPQLSPSKDFLSTSSLMASAKFIYEYLNSPTILEHWFLLSDPGPPNIKEK
jgi:hypothetical protein